MVGITILPWVSDSNAKTAMVAKPLPRKVAPTCLSLAGPAYKYKIQYHWEIRKPQAD